MELLSSGLSFAKFPSKIEWDLIPTDPFIVSCDRAILGGGNSRIFGNLQPDFLGKDDPHFDEDIFQRGGKKTPTSISPRFSGT